MRQETAGDRIASEAWAAGDHRPRCLEGHLQCRGCDACVCIEAMDGLGASMTRQVRVSTDRDGHTWCQECRYEYREYGNLRDGYDVDDRRSALASRLARQR